MVQDRLSPASYRMAVAILYLLIAMLVLNAASWLFPKLASVEGGYGIAFSLSDRLISSTGVDLNTFPWWQTLGAIFISSIPLAVLGIGLLNLRALFKSYAQGNYFSASSSLHMEKMGRAVIFWVMLNFVCEPLLSIWITMREPVGQRLLTLSFHPTDVVAFFVAACFILVARILRRAAEVSKENQLFV